MSTFYKKTILSIALFSIIFSVGVFFFPSKSEALGPEAALAVPVGEIYSIPMELKEGPYGAGFGWDTVGYMLAKVALSVMTNSIVNWINTGFEGNPTFVQNPQQFLSDAANQASGVFIQQLGAEDLLCSPFRPQLMLALKYNLPSMEKFRCTFEDAKNNWEGFMNNFTNGGWESWISITSQPQNNPYGAYLMGVDELARRKAEAQANAKMQADWGQGFNPLKKCQGAMSQEDYCDTNCDKAEDPDECWEACMEPGAFATKTTEECENAGGQMQNTTPGNIIADQLKLNLGSSVRQMELADEIGESLAAIFNALINQLITKGVSSLSEGGGGGGGGNWYDTPPTTKEKDDALKIIDNTLIYEKQYRDAKQNIVGLFDDVIANLENLKQCYKNQNPVNQTRINEIQAQINDYKNKKAPFENAVESSNAAINEAEEIKLGIINAKTYNEMNDLIARYTEEIQPTLHTALDVQNAQSEYETIKGQIDIENTRINAEYNQCLADLSNL